MVSFVKYEGLGNDFVLVEGSLGDPMFRPDQVRAWCDRRRGVGADGLLLLTGSKEGAVRMVVLNSDGSRAEMCGNGLRCVADHVAQGEARELHIETDAGVLRCLVHRRGWVCTELGTGRWVDADVTVELDGKTYRGPHISFGNPHWVLFVQSSPRGLAEAHGPRLTLDPRFPEGVNVGFADYRDGRLELVVHERGAGLTLACGTGTAAAALATWRRHPEAPNPLPVDLPGGRLWAHRKGDPERIWLEGPARRVFEGRSPGFIQRL